MGDVSSPHKYQWDPPKRRSPFVMAGALVTGAILCAGLVAFKSGNKNMSQHMMRARVLAQGATVAVMVGTSGALAMNQGLEKKDT